MAGDVMRMTNKGLAELAGHEGIVLDPYRDSVGVWTIGVGHTHSAGPPDPRSVKKPLTIEEALALFRKDVRKYEQDVIKAVNVDLAEHEFDALVSFHFNTGGIFRARLTQSLNAGDREKAGLQFMGWSKPKEIIPRRSREMVLFQTGVYFYNWKTSVFRAVGGRVKWSEAELVNLQPYFERHSHCPTS